MIILRTALVGLLLGLLAFRWSYEEWGRDHTQLWRNDLRVRDRVQAIERLRESDTFKRRLQGESWQAFHWPGLRAAQVSWTWMQMLTGIHHKESYEGDFSWLFSKLYFLIQQAHSEEREFLAGLAPFYFVMGSDHVGATVLMNELHQRSPDSYYVWFWSGYHAAENLRDRKLASDAYLRAARNPWAPPYLVGLSARLAYGDDYMNNQEKLALLEQALPQELFEKLKIHLGTDTY